jgi:hypothetical protein
MKFTIQFETCEFEIEVDFDRTSTDWSDYSPEGYGRYVDVEVRVDTITDAMLDASIVATMYEGCDDTYVDGVYTFWNGDTFTRDQYRRAVTRQIREKIMDMEDTY